MGSVVQIRPILSKYDSIILSPTSRKRYSDFVRGATTSHISSTVVNGASNGYYCVDIDSFDNGACIREEYGCVSSDLNKSTQCIVKNMSLYNNS